VNDDDLITSTDSRSTSAGIPCISCGYDLRSLPGTSSCPECGAPVALSARPSSLEHADPLFVQTCMIGTTILSLAIAVSAVHYAIQLRLPQLQDSEAFAAEIFWSVYWSIAFLEPLAVWFALTPETRAGIPLDRTGKSRIRQILATACSGRVFFHLAPIYSSLSVVAAGVLLIVVHAFIYFRLRELARRAQPALVSRASVVLALNVAGIAMSEVIPGMIGFFRADLLPSLPLPLAFLLGPVVMLYSAYVWWQFRSMLVVAANRARDNWQLHAPIAVD
jgi:hypothetical protein